MILFNKNLKNEGVMNFIIKAYCALFVVLLPVMGHADRGILMACNDKYMKYAVSNLQNLRGAHGCSLPIEIWHSGNELSDGSKEVLKRFAPISFRDVSVATGMNPSFYQGYQIKGAALALTYFEEAMIIDADVYFFQNPEVLFEHPKYIETGTFLFRDQGWSTQGGVIKGRYKKLYNHRYYFLRKKYLNKVLLQPSTFIPEEWSHYWDPFINPTQENLIQIEHGESGCVLVHRIRHKQGIQKILELNQDYQYIYTLFWGDKETYWLGFELANEPYYMNKEYPKAYFPNKNTPKNRIDLVQFVDGKMFYQQKKIKQPIKEPQFYETNQPNHPEEVLNHLNWCTPLSNEEIELMNEMYFVTESINNVL